MTKAIIGIFAHPDDEAFGPAGTLLKLKSEGYDIHLILLTDGDAGVNLDDVPDLATTRLNEWRASAALLNATSIHALHYPDGALEKIDPNELSNKVASVITEVVEKYAGHFELSFMTFEPHGLTGHRDHIAASEIATSIARTFNAHEIWYFCLDSTQASLENTAYYEPRAREDDYITTKIDISPWVESKHRVMDAHVSQRNDAEAMKKLGATTECFHIDTF